MLSLQYFRPCSDKVFKTEFHPTQPWVVSATKSDFVSIWDWNSQQVLHKVQLGEVGEGELYGDVDLGRLHLKDESVTVNLSLTGPTTSRSATGKVRDVRFLDADVVAAQVASAHALAHGTAMPTPSVAPVAAAMHGQRLVVIVCEQKVLVCDVVSRQVRELQSKTALDGKSATCCAFLYLSGFQAAGTRGAVVLPSPVLAVGCSDGLVRLFQLSTLHFLAVLTAPHKSAVTSLTVAHVKGAVHEALVATFASGNMSTWEPFAKPIGTGRGIVIQHSGDHKMHDKEVVGAVVVAVDEAPGETRSLLVTAGIDTRCVLSECPSLKEVHRHKLESKAPPCCLAYVPRGYTTANTHCLLMGTDVGVVVAVHPTLGSLRVVCNLNGQIPGGTKKMPKIYSIAVHPLQPQLVLLGTNTGMALTCLDVQITPPAAPLPLTTPGQVLDNNHEGVTFVSAVGDAVYCTTATTSQEKVREAQAIAAAAAAAAAPPPAKGAKGKDLKDADDLKDPKDAKDLKDAKPSAASLLDLLDEPVAPLPPAVRVRVSEGSAAPAPTGGAYQSDANRAPVVQVLNNSKIASGRPMSRAVLAASHDGEYMSVTWPVARQYAVYRRNAANWTEICAGVGTSVAWHACEARFAVVESPGAAPPTPTATPAKGKGGVFKSGKPSAKEQERARIEYAAAQAAALVAANTPPVVQVRACSSVGVSVVHRGLVLSPQDVAVAVTSGPMLAVTLKRQLNNSSSLYPGGEAPSAMQLYDWGKGHRVGVELPAPLVMAWDPSLTLVALAYTSQVLLCSAQPNLQPVASLPISNATGIQWGLRQVYIATPTAIYAAFVTLPNTEEQHPAPITVHTLTFACFGAPIPGLAPAIADGDPAAAGGLPPPLPRPAGPLTLLGPRDGYLWVLNVHGQAIALPLARHAGVRAMCMAASGDGQGAVQVANASLAPEHHGMIAALLCATAGTRGAGMALHLTGLGLVDDALLRLKLHQWPQAMEAVEALLVGFTHRPAQGVFSYPMSTAAFNVDSHSFMGGGMDMSGFAPTAPATGRAYVDDLDWLAPVRSAATNQATLSALSVASSAPPPASAATSPQAAALAMILLKELKGVRMQDACKYLVQMLLTYAPTLSGAQLSELILVMAELGMRQELPQVVHMLAPGCRGGSSEALGLLSALLTGHGPLVADVLGGHGGTSGGNAALAAARAASVAKDPTSKMVAVMDWQHMLEHMVTDQAPAGSGPGVHFKPLAVDA